MNPKLYWMTEGDTGRLAISARPRGGDWLEDEVTGWKRQGINVVISLLTKEEERELDVEAEADHLRRQGVKFYSFPIEDRGVPSSVQAFEKLIQNVGSEIDHGKNVAIHCRQGIGRSSLVATALMLTKGSDLDELLRRVAQVRGVNVPETSAQRQWLSQFAKAHLPEMARPSH